MWHRHLGAALLGVLAAASFVHAQERSFADQLLDRFGQKITLSRDAELKKTLVDRGLIPSDARSVTIDRAFMDRVVGNEAYWNEVRKVRYHVGDRIFVFKDGTRPHNRAEIKKINADGTYDVEVWDRTDATNPSSWIDAETGNAPGFDPKAVVRGDVKIVKMTHAEIDRANGYVDPGKGGDYLVAGLRDGADYDQDVDLVSPERDPELRKAVAYGTSVVDEWIKTGKLDLTLPADEAGRKAKLEEISKAHRMIFWDVYEHTGIAGSGGTGYPSNETTLIENGKRMIGSYKLAEVGKCSSRAQWVTAVIREVGRRIGLEIRGIRNSGHSRAILRVADGTRYGVDDYWRDYDRFAHLDTQPATYELFPDKGVLPEHQVPFASTAERKKLRAGGLSKPFFDRLEALTKGQPDPAKAVTTPEELVRRAREAGARAIGGDLTTRAPREPSRTRGVAALLEDRVQEATTRDRASRR
ncbi:MAG: hypothetical protein ACAI25_21060 [Planctomycetota bacterium]